MLRWSSTTRTRDAARSGTGAALSSVIARQLYFRAGPAASGPLLADGVDPGMRVAEIEHGEGRLAHLAESDVQVEQRELIADRAEEAQRRPLALGGDRG